MEGLIMTAQLLLSLSILIVVHEWGHFFAARMFKIKVEKFYLFFDFLFPMANVLNFSLFKWKKGDTEYGVGWFPLGGYVKIAGMVDESMDKEQMNQPPQPWEFRSKPAWQRLIVMLGGIIVNVVVGILIFIGMTYFIGDTFVSNEYVNAHGGVEARELGQSLGIKSGDKVIKINGQDIKAFDEIFKPDALLAQNANLTVQRGAEEVTISIPSNFIEKLNNKGALANFVIPRTEAIVGRIENNTIASRVLKRGDRFVEINNQPITYFDDVPAIVKQYKGDTISFSISREGKTLSFKEPFKDQSVIGFYPDYIVPKEGLISTQYSFGESVLLGPGRAIGVITLQLKAFKKIFSGDISFKKSLSGPVGMAKMYGGTWDWENLWRMTGVLSMVLAFMNLLPIPALDGGYVMFLLYEMITGREASEKFFENAIKVGMAILLALMVFVFYNDIANLFTKK